MTFTLLLVASAAAAMCGVMAAGWAFQRAMQNGGWTDVVWTFGTGSVMALTALCPLGGGSAPTLRAWLVAALVLIWSLRLGTHILLRVLHHPEDARYAAFRRDWGVHFQPRMFWFLQSQAVASGLLGISVVIAARNPAPHLMLTDILGACFLVLSIVGEGIADAQLATFKKNPANKGKVCDVGLWSWSRHPNYFFEWLIWLAYPVMASGGLPSLWWLAFTAPLLMYYLLTQVSGIPPLEETMLASRGASYADYQRRVSAFFLWPPQK